MTRAPADVPPAAEAIPDLTPEADTSVVAASAAPSAVIEVSRPAIRLATPILAHTGVDYLSFAPLALMPLLAQHVGFDETGKALLLSLGPVASGAVQPVVAYLGDRFDTRVFGPLGIIVAVLAVSSFGFVNSYPMALIAYVLATLGVGAFHPPAAAAVGSLAGRRRSIMLSIFFLAGMIGGVAGNTFSPMWVAAFASWSGEVGAAATTVGLRSLALLIPAALLVAAALAWATFGRSHHHPESHARQAAMLPEVRRKRWRAFYLLYAGNAMRYPVNIALVYLFVEWTTYMATQRHADATPDQLGLIASGLNGPMQAAMQVGMGGGGILMGLLLRPKLEKPAFIALPLLGAIPVAIFPIVEQLPGAATYVAAFAMTVLMGVGFGAMFPVSLSLGQRLLPHRTAFASGMLLGGAWTLGVFGAWGARGLHHWIGLHNAFLVVAAFLAISGVLMLALPGRLLRELDSH